MQDVRLQLSIKALIIILLFSPAFTFGGESKEEGLKRFKDRIKVEKKRVKETRKKERSILTELENIEKILKEKEGEFKDYEGRVKETEGRLKKAEFELDVVSSKIEEKRAELMERLKAIYKERRRGYLSALIGAETLDEFLRRYKYLRVIANQDRLLIDNYRADMGLLKKEMASLETLRDEVLLAKKKVQEKAEEVRAEKNKKLTILASLITERSTRERLVQELEEAARRIEAFIREADRRKIPPPPGLSFANYKGWLPWPTEGRLISLFGTQRDTEFNTPVFKRGIEIGSSIGEDIKAVFGGMVIYADWFKGYGKLLIINHGNRYYTLYAHASEVFPKVGDKVIEGQVIGKVGDTGSLKGPMLYFEIRHKGEAVDPLVWLKKR